MEAAMQDRGGKLVKNEGTGNRNRYGQNFRARDLKPVKGEKEGETEQEEVSDASTI